jgi:hypothetical protein
MVGGSTQQRKYTLTPSQYTRAELRDWVRNCDGPTVKRRSATGLAAPSFIGNPDLTGAPEHWIGVGPNAEGTTVLPVRHFQHLPITPVRSVLTVQA